MKAALPLFCLLAAAGPSACCTGGTFAPPPGLTHNVGQPAAFQPGGAAATTGAAAPASAARAATGTHTATITPVVTQRMGKKAVLVHRLIRPPRTLGAIEAHEVTGANGETTLLLGPAPAGKEAAGPAAAGTATPIEAVVVP